MTRSLSILTVLLFTASAAYNKKLLKLYFHQSTRISAYFDYDGVAMPKARLMIPAKYYDAKQDQAFVPFLIK